MSKPCRQNTRIDETGTFKDRMKGEFNLLYPLDEFYAESGLTLPSLVRVNGKDIPEPYKSLLVHENDMTPTLENAYHQKIRLRVLKHQLSGNVFSREVLLTLDHDGRAVEFGAIRIYLDRLPFQARQPILEGRRPLGSILHTQDIEHTSWPEAYVQVATDDAINRALNLTGSYQLYGRRNRLLDASRRTLAEIIEILPPSKNLRSFEKDGQRKSP